MFVIWWRLPGSCWTVHNEMFWTTEEAALRIPMVVRLSGGAAECVILPTGEVPGQAC